jgi:predicted methyltransferase MtxX (methanogen marker protein 4)
MIMENLIFGSINFLVIEDSTAATTSKMGVVLVLTSRIEEKPASISIE